MQFEDPRLVGGRILPTGAGEARLDGAAVILGPYAARLIALCEGVAAQGKAR